MLSQSGEFTACFLTPDGRQLGGNGAACIDCATHDTVCPLRCVTHRVEHCAAGARLIGGNKHGKLLIAQANDCSVEAECQAFEAPIIAVVCSPVRCPPNPPPRPYPRLASCHARVEKAEFAAWCAPLSAQSGFNTPTILGADREAGRSVLLLAACTRKQVRLYKLHCAESEAASGVEGDAADGAAAATAEGSLELLGKVRSLGSLRGDGDISKISVDGHRSHVRPLAEGHASCTWHLSRVVLYGSISRISFTLYFSSLPLGDFSSPASIPPLTLFVCAWQWDAQAMLPTGKDTHAVLGNLEFSPCGKVLMFTGTCRY